MTTLIAAAIPVWKPDDFHWGDLAACDSHPDPDIWHADETSSAAWDVEAKEEAKKICTTMCLVRGDCLAYAMRTRQSTGIWGGLGPRERTRLPRTTSQIPNSMMPTACGITRLSYW